ncbi:histidine phosphatase family protein, partial [Streptomyces sp. NPDC006290]|uniref:histidine phosphatase family protein n=1 Tax=Streptomyces sp. NPDC006290 TaxID=3156745 RepID=UPI0033AF2FA4
MGDLILVRHGETEWTLTGQHTSWTDLPLTGHGEEQAKSLAPFFAGHSFAQVLTSPLGRAVRTAELAGLSGARIDPDLHEWDYGGYEGITTIAIHRARPDWVLWNDGVRARIRKHQRRAARAPKGSEARTAAHATVARLRAREADRRKDWCEKTSTMLARTYDLVR